MAWFNNLMSMKEFSSSVQSVREGKELNSFKVKSNTKGKYFSQRGNTFHEYADGANEYNKETR